MSIKQNGNLSHNDRIRNVFAGEVSEGWDTKGELIDEMRGNDNIVYQWIEENMTEEMRLLDVGCATGRLIQKMDKRIVNSGIDISADMAAKAQSKLENARNSVKIVNNAFIEHDFGNDKFDIIVFKFVLHHMENGRIALLKAKELLNNGGRIIIYTPGSRHLDELFKFDNKCSNDFLGRKSEEQLVKILQEIHMGTDKINKCEFKMRFNNFSNLIGFLKRTGIYQKIIGYENKEWDKALIDSVRARYEDKMWNMGEFLLAVYTKS